MGGQQKKFGKGGIKKIAPLAPKMGGTLKSYNHIFIKYTPTPLPLTNFMTISLSGF